MIYLNFSKLGELRIKRLSSCLRIHFRSLFDMSTTALLDTIGPNAAYNSKPDVTCYRIKRILGSRETVQTPPPHNIKLLFHRVFFFFLPYPAQHGLKLADVEKQLERPCLAVHALVHVLILPHQSLACCERCVRVGELRHRELDICPRLVQKVAQSWNARVACLCANERVKVSSFKSSNMLHIGKKKKIRCLITYQL